MNRIKKIAALTLALLMLVSLSACGSFEARMVKAGSQMKDLESMHMDLEMLMDISISFIGQDMDMDISMTGGMDIQSEPGRIKMDMVISMMGLEQQVLSYVEKVGETYEVSSSVDGGNSWARETVSQEEAPAQMDMSGNLQFFIDCAKSFEEVGTENVLGSPATRYDGEISGEGIEAALKASGAEDMLDQSLGGDIDMSDISENGSIPASVWIDDESGMLVRYDMDMTQLMQSLMGPVLKQMLDLPEIATASMELSVGRVTFSVILSQFNAVEEIIIPAQISAA